MRQSDNRDKKAVIRDPLVIVIHLLLAGIVVLFLGLTYGYIFQMGNNWIDFRLPKVFWLSTVLILLVSLMLNVALKEYDRDNLTNLRSCLILALVFAVFFIVCQLNGWRSLNDAEINLQTSPSSSYLFLLTGLHGIHVIVGIVFLMVATIRVVLRSSDQVKSLVYFSDPARRTRLKLLRNYWHTIDVLWLFLFFVFLYHHT